MRNLSMWFLFVRPEVCPWLVCSHIRLPSDPASRRTPLPIVTDAVTTHTVTLDALTADGSLIQRRTFADVGLRNGYRTIYRGAFFTDQSFTSTFTAQDWQDNEVVEF